MKKNLKINSTNKKPLDPKNYMAQDIEQKKKVEAKAALKNYAYYMRYKIKGVKDALTKLKMQLSRPSIGFIGTSLLRQMS